MTDDPGAGTDPSFRVTCRLWTISGSVTSALLLILIGLWVAEARHRVDSDQLTDADTVEFELQKVWSTKDEPDALQVPTGVFVQSLQFVAATDVHMTGYVWQQFSEKSKLDDEDLEPGFILPELVDSSFPLRLEYREPQGDGEVIGWYFEGTVRQPFEYSDYPFDHKDVWLRIWPKDFAANTVLIPDLSAYPDGTSVDKTFGVDETIVLGDWEREDTYFDFFVADYNTNFGIDNYVGQDDFPELRYTMLINRRFQNAFIVNMIPLFVVAMLAFAALITTTKDPERSAIFGFNTSGSIGTLSALFFVVLLAHIQLRQEFPGAGVVYLEWFYFMMYAVLLGVTVNTYLVTAPWSAESWLVSYRDNLIPKVMYWPTLIGAMVVITIISFWTS